MNQLNKTILIFITLLFNQSIFGQELKSNRTVHKGLPLESLFWVDEDAHFSNAYQLKKAKKVGIGGAVGGALGLASLQVELNFEEDNSAIAGFGSGPGYNSILLGWRHLENNRDLNLYYTLGFSKWYTEAATGNVNQSSTLRALYNKERLRSDISTNFLIGSLGTQFFHLNGELAGLSFFGELTFMLEVGQSKIIPTGAVGSVLYF